MRRKTELTNKKAPGWLRETKLLYVCKTDPFGREDKDLLITLAFLFDPFDQKRKKLQLSKTLHKNLFVYTEVKDLI